MFALLSSNVYSQSNFTTTQAGDWSAGSTWSGGNVPGSSDNATIAHNVSVNGTTTINDLTINGCKMNNKTLGIIAIVFGSLVLYSEQEYAWIISAVLIGVGTGIWFWKDKKRDTEK